MLKEIPAVGFLCPSLITSSHKHLPHSLGGLFGTIRASMETLFHDGVKLFIQLIKMCKDSIFISYHCCCSVPPIKGKKKITLHDHDLVISGKPTNSS